MKHIPQVRRLSSYIYAVVVLCVLAACSSIECALNGQVLCHYSIQNAKGEEDVVTCPLSVTFLDTAFGNDSVYINRWANLKELDIPMSHIQDADGMAITLHTTDSTEVSDTIWLKKTNEPWFESVDCAAHYNHTVTSASSTHHFVDTIIINKPLVSNDASVKNIFIRLHHSY